MSEELALAPPSEVAWYGDWHRQPDPTPPPTPKPPKKPAKGSKAPTPQDEEKKDPPPDRPPESTGLILGRFLPPHRGHQFLVDFARASVRELTLILHSTPADPIPAELRMAWLRELFPTARPIRVETDGCRLSWEAWESLVRKHLPGGVGYLFASEPPARALASLLDAEFVCVDPERLAVPVSGTRIRSAPLRNWAFLPDCVRPWFLRRVGVVGAEGTGKTTLAQRLAAHYGTACVPEFARSLARERGGLMSGADLERAARGQVAMEMALAWQANRLLVCDTDLATVGLWMERLGGVCPAWIREEARRQSYDLVLVPELENDWTGGSTPGSARERAAFLDRLVGDLDARGQRWLMLRGSWHERFLAAKEAIDGVLAELSPDPRPGEDA